MSKIAELHELVHSMTQKEQTRMRSILESHIRGNSNQQLDLYLALINTPSLEHEATIRQQLGAKHRKNLPTLMRRLYESILNNLSSSSNDLEVSGRLAGAVRAVGVLYEKQLHDQAKKVLHKAKKLAEAFEESNYHLQLIAWERKFIVNERQPNGAELLHNLFLQQQAVSRELGQQIETRHLRDQVLELNRNKALPDQEKKARLQEIIAQPILEQCRYARDIRSRINANATLGTCHFELGNTEEAVEIYAHLLDFWEAHPTWINEYPENYLEDFTLFQYMILRDSSRLDLLEKHIESIKRLPLARPDLQFRLKYYGFQMQIVVYLNFLKWEQARTTIREALNWMETDAKMFTPAQRMAFLYNFAVLHFFTDEFTTARKFTTRIIDERSRQKRIDLRAASRLLNLVIYLEEEDYDFAEYQLRATRAWLKRQSLLSPFAKAFLRLAQQIIDSAGRNTADLIKQHKESLTSLPPIQGSNEITFWMESKVRNISLREVCEELIPEMR